MQCYRTIFFFFLCILSVRGHSLKGSYSSHSSKNQQLANLREYSEDSLREGHEMNNDDYNNDDNYDGISKEEENLGKHYFQGDILTTSDQMEKINHLLYHHSSTFHDQADARALIKDVERTWENGVVPFTIERKVGDRRRQIVKEAIDHWEKKTCLRFKKRSNEKDYVQFEEGDGCSSYVGRIGGKQDITVGNQHHRCRVGNIIHEIGHAVGFFHEQSRPDRDKFVDIKWNNVLKGYRLNFVKFSRSIVDSKDVPYDYGSIMHYPRKIFGKKSREPTVIPKEHGAKIGQRNGLSAKDILQASLLYGCTNDRNSIKY